MVKIQEKSQGDKPSGSGGQVFTQAEGARLAIKWFDHDFGSYSEVVCWYELEDATARDYVFRCENETPLTWEGGRREQLRIHLGLKQNFALQRIEMERFAGILLEAPLQ